MSRVIKFRAWIKPDYMGSGDGGEMIAQDSKCDFSMVSNGTGFGVVYDYETWIKDSEYEIMQFTGLLDNNKKEIFEDDICLWHTTESDFNPIWPIKWKDKISAFCHGNMPIVNLFQSGFYQPSLGREPWAGEGLEIIGNVHENPELLEGG